MSTNPPGPPEYVEIVSSAEKETADANLDPWWERIEQAGVVLAPGDLVMEMGCAPDGKSLYRYLLRTRVIERLDADKRRQK